MRNTLTANQNRAMPPRQNQPLPLQAPPEPRIAGVAIGRAPFQGPPGHQGRGGAARVTLNSLRDQRRWGMSFRHGGSRGWSWSAGRVRGTHVSPADMQGHQAEATSAAMSRKRSPWPGTVTMGDRRHDAGCFVTFREAIDAPCRREKARHSPSHGRASPLWKRVFAPYRRAQRMPGCEGHARCEQRGRISLAVGTRDDRSRAGAALPARRASPSLACHRSGPEAGSHAGVCWPRRLS